MRTLINTHLKILKTNESGENVVYDKKLVFLLYKDFNHEENEHNIKKAKHIKENSLKYNHII